MPRVQKNPPPEVRRQPAPNRGGIQATPVDVDEGMSAAASRLPRLPTKPAFLLKYHPDRWMVVEGRLTPLLGSIKLRGGENNVAETKNGRILPGRAKSIAEAEGWTVIPTSWGPGGKSYLTAVDVKGGRHHMTVFETAYAGSDQVGSNTQALHDWLWGLIRDGKLAPPAEHVLRALREKTNARWVAAVDKARTQPSFEARALQFKAELAVLDEALVEFAADAVPITDATPVDVPDDGATE